MYRATTPTHRFKLPFETELIDKLQLTYKQDKNILEFCENDVDFETDKIIVKLTQEQTKAFTANAFVEIQARMLMNDGSVIASNIIKVRTERVLNDEVIA